MDLATLLVSCSLHADDVLLTAVAYAHSRGNPYVVTNVRLDVLVGQDEPPLAPTSLPVAHALMTRILEAGGEPIVGILPARRPWAAEYGKTTNDLFDPCTNIAVASAKISQLRLLLHTSTRGRLQKLEALLGYLKRVGRSPSSLSDAFYLKLHALLAGRLSRAKVLRSLLDAEDRDASYT